MQAMPTKGTINMILCGDSLQVLSGMTSGSVHCCITSPPYWGLRAYGGEAGMIGLEPTLDEHIERLVALFREVRRVLRDDGTLWLNYGDTYCGGGRGAGVEGTKQATNVGTNGAIRSLPKHADGLKPKDLMMLPARVALALQADGWWLRSEIVWAKPNPMPESVNNRPTSAHEKVFLFAKSGKPTYWVHPERDGVRVKPEPDYEHLDDGTRRNLWRGRDYFYDAAAVRTGSNGWNGDFAARAGERRDGKGKGSKRRGHHRPHQGFNDEWDAMSKPEQQAGGANLRNVWHIATAPLSGVAVYGTYRIGSLDCPIHGCLDDLARALQCGELQVSSDSPRSLGTRGRPDQVREGVAYAIAEDQYESLSDLTAAIRHSNAIHRMAYWLEQHDSFDGKSLSDIAYSEESRHCDASGDHIPANNTSADCASNGKATYPSGQTGHHILGIPFFNSPLEGCTCKYTGKVEKVIDHFASFPPALVEPCIKAGTSHKGVCSACGAPWERMVDKEWQKRWQKNTDYNTKIDTHTQPSKEDGFYKTQTLGWRPSCACKQPGFGAPYPVKPAIVLDPFAGAGTVNLVVQRLGHRSIGIEISPKYARMAQQRCEQDLPVTQRPNRVDPDEFKLEFSP